MRVKKNRNEIEDKEEIKEDNNDLVKEKRKRKTVNEEIWIK